MNPLSVLRHSKATTLQTDKTENNREQVEQYLASGGEGVELTEKQKQLLERWTFADEMIRVKMGTRSRGEIAKMIMVHFDVALCTAKADMVAAEAVFSSSNPLNKKHRIQLRIEFLEKQSARAAEDGDYAAVAALEKSIAKYIEIYPELSPVESPKTLVFKFDVDKLRDKLVDPDEATTVIDEQLAKLKLIGSLAEDIEVGGEDE